MSPSRFEAGKVVIMSSKRFVPCGLAVLAMFGFGAQVLNDESSVTTWTVAAGCYIAMAILVLAFRKRIANWWCSSIVLPCGCAALLMFAGLSAISRVEWRTIPSTFTESAPASQQPQGTLTLNTSHF